MHHPPKKKLIKIIFKMLAFSLNILKEKLKYLRFFLSVYIPEKLKLWKKVLAKKGVSLMF